MTLSSPQLLMTASVLVALTYLAVVSVLSVVAALRAGGRREEPDDSHDALAASRLTMPVSIVVPAGACSVSTTVEHLLARRQRLAEAQLAGGLVEDRRIGESAADIGGQSQLLAHSYSSDRNP